MRHLSTLYHSTLVLLASGLLLFAMGCDSDSDPVGMDPDPDPDPDIRQVTYDLPNVEGNGITGSDATATFQELDDNRTLVTLEFEDGATDTEVSHTAHIHEGALDNQPGDIVIFLGPIDGLGAASGSSEFVVDRSFDELVDFDGYINIHESNAELGNILAQGDIGSNASSDVVESTLDPVDDPRSTSYDLGAVSNEGAVPDGDTATATFTEVTETQTLVTLELEGRATGTEVSHVAHIHEGSLATQPGDIAIFLGPIDGLGSAPGVSYALVDQAYDDLVAFDGYINIHESNAALGNILAQGNIGANAGETELRQASYNLDAQSNNGAIPSGVEGSVTFWELNDSQTLVTLDLGDEETGANVSHPAHIHENDAETGGGIVFYLTPIDGSDPGAASARVIDEPFDTLADFDGYVNVHESLENLGTIVSQGNIGSNADTDVAAGLDIVDNPRSTDYDLSAIENDGQEVPNGAPGTAKFAEVTADLTLITLNLDIDGATEADVSHPAHIHENDVATGGGIAFYLGPIDGSDPDSKSSMLIAEPYDTLTDFDGYINIHESVANLGDIVSQGNIGANAENGDDSSNGGGY